jgi:hypothetical protein
VTVNLNVQAVSSEVEAALELPGGQPWSDSRFLTPLILIMLPDDQSTTY